MKTKKFDAGTSYFTSDLHFFHKYVSTLRGFNDPHFMNNYLIHLWNEMVPEDSNVFILGDVSFGKPLETVDVLKQLNGNLHLIKGNHDKNLKQVVLNEFVSVQDYLEIDVIDDCYKKRVILFHYAMRVWNRSHFGSYHLYGHSHGSLPGTGRSMDVGIDNLKPFPLSFKEIDDILKVISVEEVDHHRGRTS